MSTATHAGPGLVARALLALVWLYRAVPKSGLPRCRFAPSCSDYALDALREHGAIWGSALTIWRVLRCNPFHPGGIDRVPPRRTPARGLR
jgi:putative membrane protein insertion efficiency factor